MCVSTVPRSQSPSRQLRAIRRAALAERTVRHWRAGGGRERPPRTRMAASGEGEVLAANQGTTASLGEHAAIHGTNNQNRNQNR